MEILWTGKSVLSPLFIGKIVIKEKKLNASATKSFKSNLGKLQQTVPARCRWE